MNDLLNTITIDPKELSYRVFIVRCWVEETPVEGQAVVRYTLDVPATGDRCGFITHLPRAISGSSNRITVCFAVQYLSR